MALQGNRIEANGAGDRQLRSLLVLGSMGDRSDGELLARFVAGAGSADRGAAEAAELVFGVLVERHGGTVLRSARAILGDEAASLDASQATFLLLAERARSLRVGDSLAPWLATVARRVALGVRRAEARRARHERVAARPEAVATATTTDDRAEAVRVVLAEVDALPEPYRRAVAACHLDGLTQHAAAARLGWPVGTLQSRLDRGRRRLRARLARRGFAPTALGLLPPAGWPSTFPPTLVPPLARLAAGWAIRSPAPSALAPGVLAALHAAKGTAMTKLVPLALALLTATGLAATGVRRGIVPGPGNQPILFAQATPPGDPQAAPTFIDKPTETLKDAVKPDAATKLDAGRPAAIPTPEGDLAPPPAAAAAEKIPQPEGVPALFLFMPKWPDGAHSAGQKAREKAFELEGAGYPIRWVNFEHPASQTVARRYQVDTYPTFVMTDGSGADLGHMPGTATVRELAEFFNKHIPTKPDQGATTEGEPALSLAPEVPRPWATAARLKITREARTGLTTVSGTVLWSDAQDALILTAAHPFFGPGGQVPDPKQFRGAVAVDLFDGKLRGLNPAQVGQAPGQARLSGKLVEIDATEDLALVQIHPDAKLPAAPVAPDGRWSPAQGDKMLAVGCSNGADATTWNTTVLEPETPVANVKGKAPFSMLKATLAPRVGRTGGGLFTPRGHLVGVNGFGNSLEDVGLYVTPKSIHKFLGGKLSIDRQTGEVGTIPRRDASVMSAAGHTTLAASGKPALPWAHVDPEAPAVTPIEGPLEESAPPTSNSESSPAARLAPAPPQSGVMLVPAGDSTPTGPSRTTAATPTNVAPRPRPWETVVRIRNHLSSSEVGMGSGVVIASTADESIILCCAHHLRDNEGKLALDRPFPRITVDLFSDQFRPGGPQQLPCIRTGIVGEPVAVNVAEDFALIRIRPGRVLPSAPIAPAPWEVARGMPLVALGCSHGEDATARDVQVIDPRIKMGSGSDVFHTIKCSGQPEEGRSGGGLFTQDGYLVGICNYADPQEKVGLYRETRAFRGLIECLEPAGGGVKFDLAAAVRAVPKLQLVGSPPALITPAEPAPVPAVSQERRLSDLERKLDRVLESLDNKRGEPGLTPFRSHGGLGP